MSARTCIRSGDRLPFASRLLTSWEWILRRSDDPGLLRRVARCRSTAGRFDPLRTARKPRFMPTRSSGKAMADRETEIIAKIASGVSGFNARAWDRLNDGGPFTSHAFLAALEDSGSVGPGTGWTPAPILVEDGEDHLIAAAPAYLKAHSQGEYVFDHE